MKPFVSAPDEPQWIERAMEGDLDAFNQLVLHYQNLAYSVAYRMLHDSEATADAVQESFLKACRALDTFRGPSFKSWMMRIVVNTCYDILRTRQRYPTTSLEGATLQEEYASAFVDTTEGPQGYIERMELNDAIELGVRILPDEQKAVLLLRDVHGYSYEEIVEVTGASMGTVKSRINRARGRLRDFLLEHAELLPPSFRPIE